MCFLFVLVGAVGSESSLLFITSNVRRDNNFICWINVEGAIVQCYRSVRF